MERFRMSHRGAPGAPRAARRAVGKFNQIQGILYEGLKLVQRAEFPRIELAGHAAIEDGQRFAADVLAKLKELEEAEPELAADLVDNGITMAGGSSLLRGLTTVVSHATGLDVRLAEDPLTCVARGTSVYLENLELWKETMESDADDI